jgi:hypothetical protein
VIKKIQKEKKRSKKKQTKKEREKVVQREIFLIKETNDTKRGF